MEHGTVCECHLEHIAGLGALHVIRPSGRAPCAFPGLPMKDNDLIPASPARPHTDTPKKANGLCLIDLDATPCRTARTAGSYPIHRATYAAMRPHTPSPTWIHMASTALSRFLATAITPCLREISRRRSGLSLMSQRHHEQGCYFELSSKPRRDRPPLHQAHVSSRNKLYPYAGRPTAGRIPADYRIPAFEGHHAPS